eukprot:347468-Chlamydomonas_euryale.AAC.5
MRHIIAGVDGSQTDPSVDGAPRSVADDVCVEQLKVRPGHRNIQDFSGMYSSAIRGCHEEVSSGGTTFLDFVKDPSSGGRTALDRQAWRDAFEKLAPLEFKTPQQAGHMTWSALAMAGVAYVTQPFLVCDPVARVSC